MIRLYGIEKGNGSWARVSAGVREGLTVNDRLASFYDVGLVDAAYDDDGDALDMGYDAPVGLCIGAPPSASVMVGRGEHKHRLLMIATNSSWLSAVMMERAAKMCTGFVAPSAWSANIIARYVDLPVLVYPHGVDEAFKPGVDALPPGAPFRALHLASTHMERKGTRELIFGWSLAMQRGLVPIDAKLRLVADGPRGYFNDAIFKAACGSTDIAESIELHQRLELDTNMMAAFYRQHHMVVQPSRGEGFGMVPLEARACGIPVVATLCTGHGQHMGLSDAGVVPVAHGLATAVDDGPGAMAPTVEPEAIVEALGKAVNDYAALRQECQDAAADVRKRWQWAAVTRRFLDTNAKILGT
jgi:glycosyltransferase involved in cell wall biosynthesis